MDTRKELYNRSNGLWDGNGPRLAFRGDDGLIRYHNADGGLEITTYEQLTDEEQSLFEQLSSWPAMIYPMEWNGGKTHAEILAGEGTPYTEEELDAAQSRINARLEEIDHEAS